MRKIVLQICILCTILMVACVKVENTESVGNSDKKKIYDDRFTDDAAIKYFGNSNRIAGGTLVDNLQIQSGLFFYDIQNDSKIAVCNVPGCTHLESDKECYVNTHTSQANALYKERVFYFEYDNSDEKATYTRLCLINRDGSNRVVLKEHKDVQAECLGVLLVDSKLFVQYRVSDVSVDDNGFISIDEAYYSLCRIDMETDNYCCIYEGAKCKGVPGANTLYFYDNKIICSYTTLDKNYLDVGYTAEEYIENMIDILEDPEYETKFGVKENTIIYNLENEMITDISDKISETIKKNGSYVAWWAGYLFFMEDSKLVLYNIDKDEFSDYAGFDNNDYDIYAVKEFDDFLYINASKFHGESDYYVLPPNSLEAYKFNADIEAGKELFTISDENEDYVEMVLVPEDLAEGVDLVGLMEDIYMPKSDFYARVTK